MGVESLSLIESVEIHEIEHVVRSQYPDDELPDFLANDVEDEDDLPDAVHLSEGPVLPVTAIVEGTVVGPISDADLEAQLTVPGVPEAWMYIRIPDPGNGRYDLVEVTRSDGQSIRVTDNAWTTHRVIREQDLPPLEENRLHLFDFGGSGQYTLVYANSDQCPDDPNKTEPGQCGCGVPDVDADGDGIPDCNDQCPNDPANNDVDGDGVCGDTDNCPADANADQADSDEDGIGDVCDACPTDPTNDADGDAVCAGADNCPNDSNAGQEDGDGDGAGDACDSCPNDADDDADGDGVCADTDNCPTDANPDQANTDGDALGDL